MRTKELIAIVIILIITLIVALSSKANAQDGIWLNGYVDGKLLVSDDDYGNTAPTFDTNLIVSMQGYDTKFGFLSIQAKFEYADINPRMIRYSAGAGFTFNGIKRLEFTPSINYGRIIRYERAFSSFEGTFDVAYVITPKFKVMLMGALTQRTDIKNRWGGKMLWRESGFIGIGYKIK